MYVSEYDRITLPSLIKPKNQPNASTQQAYPQQSTSPQDINISLTTSANDNYYQQSYPSYPQHYQVPELNFAPPAHEVLEHSNAQLQAQIESNNTHSVYQQFPQSNVSKTMYQSSGFYINPYPTMEGPVNNNQYVNQTVNISQPVSVNQLLNTSQPMNMSYNVQQVNTQAQVSQVVVPQSPVQGSAMQTSVNVPILHSSSVVVGNNTLSSTSIQQSSVLRNQSFNIGHKKTSYLSKRIENDLIKRTGVIGNLDAGTKEFDDYFEVHTEKFFTPELHEIIFYHDNKHFYGIQMIYRDPWGKFDKETYKGELHMSKKISPKSCAKSVFNLDYDEYLTELYVYGKEEITYFKLVTNEGKVFELGEREPNMELLNLVTPLTRIMGIGGTYDLYLNGAYFYYN